MATGTPRWVKVFAAIALVLVLVVVIGLVTGRAGPGDHGPGRHASPPGISEDGAPSGGPGGHKPPPGIPKHGVRQP